MDLETVIAYLVAAYHPKRFGRTTLVKAVYCLAYFLEQEYGEVLPQVRFARWDHGPYDAAIIEAANRVEGLHENHYISFYGSRAYEYVIDDTSLLVARSKSLRPHLKSLANTVVELFDMLGSTDGILDYVYATPPMVEQLALEQQAGNPIFGRKLDMNKRPDVVYTPTREQIRQALKKRAEEFQEKGSDEDYYANLVKEFQELADIRRRATSCTEE